MRGTKSEGEWKKDNTPIIIPSFKTLARDISHRYFFHSNNCHGPHSKGLDITLQALHLMKDGFGCKE